MRIIKKWIGRKPESAGDMYLLEVTQAEMFEQMYPLLGQLALHATSGRDVDYRLYFICENGRRILPVDKPSVMSGAFNGGIRWPIARSSQPKISPSLSTLPHFCPPSKPVNTCSGNAEYRFFAPQVSPYLCT